MKKKDGNRFAVLLVLGWGLTAFTGVLGENALSWYQKTRFAVADLDEDGYLVSQEIRLCPSEFIFFIHLDGFQYADADRNGRIDPHEWDEASLASMRFREESERAALVRLSQEYPFFETLQLSYLKRHPELAMRLFSNLYWASKHPAMIQSLAVDKLWWKHNPEALQAISLNFALLAAFPEIAMAVYRFELPASVPAAARRWREAHTLWLAKGGTQLDLETFSANSSLLAGIRAAQQQKRKEDSLAAIVRAQTVVIERLRLALDSFSTYRSAEIRARDFLEADPAAFARKMADLERALQKSREELRLSLLEEDRLMGDMYALKAKVQLGQAADFAGAPPPELASENARLRHELDALRQSPTTLTTNETKAELDRLRAEAASFDMVRQALIDINDENALLFRQVDSMRQLLATKALGKDVEQTQKLLAQLQRERDSLARAASDLSRLQSEQAELQAELATLKETQRRLLLVETDRVGSLDPAAVADGPAPSVFAALSDSLNASKAQIRALESRVAAWEEDQLVRSVEAQRTLSAEKRLSEMENRNLRLLQERDSLLRPPAPVTAAAPALADSLAAARDRIYTLEKLIAASDAQNQVAAANERALSAEKRLSELENRNLRLLRERDSLLMAPARFAGAAPALADSLAAIKSRMRILEKRVATWETDQEARLGAEERADRAEARLARVLRSTQRTLAEEDSVQQLLLSANNRIRRLEFILRQARDEIEEYRTLAAKPLSPTPADPKVTERMAALEQQQQSLKNQLANNTQYLAQVVAEKKRIESELSSELLRRQQATAAQDSAVRARNAALQQLKYAQDSLRIVRMAARELQAAASAWERRYLNTVTNRSLNIDSLRTVVASLEKQLYELKNTERVERQRITQVEKREAEAARKSDELEARERKLQQREKTLEVKIQETENRAKRYQDLEKRERELKLLEQQLKTAGG